MDIDKIRKYKNDFDKENYKQFKAKLKPKEMEEVNDFLEKNGMNKREFVLISKKILERGMYMKKYLVYKNTQHFEKRGEWISTGDCADTKNVKTFDNKEEAEKYYNELELQDVISGDNRYSDYKSMYEYDATEITDEMINDDEYDLDNMKFIKDDYSFIE